MFLLRMIISQKGNPRIRRLCVTCFREAGILRRMGRCTIGSAGSIWKSIRTGRKDPELERRTEDVLDAYGIFYNKSEFWIESERLYEVLYMFEWEV